MEGLEHLADIYSSSEFKEQRERWLSFPIEGYKDVMSHLPIGTLITNMIEMRFYFPELNLPGSKAPESIREKYNFLLESIGSRESRYTEVPPELMRFGG